MASDLFHRLPVEWRTAILPYVDRTIADRLSEFVLDEYAARQVFPPIEDLFNAYRLCSPEQTRVLILGQDPYHQPGQAHGLSFSVRPGVPIPPSLRNIYKELRDDIGVEPPRSGDLTGWATQGVLLLNAVLTVRAGAATSHANRGWEHITDATIRALNAREARVVFVLWGAYARRKAGLVDQSQHVVIEAGHPSPMNPTGFLGSRPFSAIGKALAEVGASPIRWS
ncbi:MAG TPA: uracil-DNA glycosylase [Micromonosporaceae bacterium]|jgi:uracil-DNA glycosylase|nr:uracil-DNA glycosylase [Micromonosporaceae bacterium]